MRPQNEGIKENIHRKIAKYSCRTALKGKLEHPPLVQAMSTCRGTAHSTSLVIM
jgi:hypothetical protein